MQHKNKNSDSSDIEISFEMFPPKSDEFADKLRATIIRLSALQPDFFTITYGAGGSSKGRSLKTAAMISAAVDYKVAAHLTCAGAGRTELHETIGKFLNTGIDMFVALRGDPHTGIGTSYVPHAEGYSDTADLVADMKRLGATDVSVSAYPERHPDSPHWGHEIDVLKRKADAGADRAVTQFFFDNDDFDRYRDRVEAAGISIPIVPGILPVHNIRKVTQFAAKCGADIPEKLLRRFQHVEPDTDDHAATAAEFASDQVEDLKARGVRHFHFYTMNEARLTETVCRSILPRRSVDKSAA